ncbi:MAG: hypothetical protein WB767_11550, partial [Nocardioides sp.]
MDRLRQSVIAAEARLGSRGAAWSAVLAVVAQARGVTGGEGTWAADLEPWCDPGAADLLGTVHESLVTGRHESGTFYTPP